MIAYLGEGLNQYGRTHQIFVYLARYLTAFVDRPYHEALSATHVSGGKYFIYIGRIFAIRRFHIGTAIRFKSKRSTSVCSGPSKPMAMNAI